MHAPGHRTAHDGYCPDCKAAFILPMAEAVIIRRNFIWVCPKCERQNKVRLTSHNALKLRALFHTCYGTRISPDEVAAFAANLDHIDEAITTEITV